MKQVDVLGQGENLILYSTYVDEWTLTGQFMAAEKPCPIIRGKQQA